MFCNLGFVRLGPSRLLSLPPAGPWVHQGPIPLAAGDAGSILLADFNGFLSSFLDSCLSEGPRAGPLLPSDHDCDTHVPF